MRKGQNPSKDNLPAYQPERLGIAIVSYIPNLAGYFEHSLEVLKYEIASIHHSTKAGFDLYVFDNGSCPEVQSELHNLNAGGWVDFLFSSRYNLGKIGAINWILGAIPNEFICYADSDILFRPGWYEHSLNILETFSGAGLVSAQPCFDDVLHGKGRAQSNYYNDPAYQVSDEAIDPKWIDEFSASLGYTPEQTVIFKNKLYKMITHRQTKTKAIFGAAHAQFLMPRDVGRQIVPLPATMSLSRKEDFNLNQKVDQKGYLHLSTIESYYYHMGNMPDHNIMAEIASMELEKIYQTSLKKNNVGPSLFVRILRRFSHLPLLGSLIFRMYKLLFEIYS